MTAAQRANKQYEEIWKKAEKLSKPAFSGVLYYVSKDAKAKRLYEEGRSVTIESYKSHHMLFDSCVQIDLDSSGTAYVHLQLKEVA